jgi:hypothetical protein
MVGLDALKIMRRCCFKLEEKMNFLDKVSYNGKIYIHESRVPISCGGTMEDTNDWCRSCFVQNPCGNAIKRRDEAVLGGKTLSQVAKEKAMNKDNYVTLPVALRLGLKGIFLDTEKHWEYKIYATGGEWHLSDDKGNVPAPNMSELWRELPPEKIYHKEGGIFEHCPLTLTQHMCGYSQVGYPAKYLGFKLFDNTNPCDALAELLMALREQIGEYL